MQSRGLPIKIPMFEGTEWKVNSGGIILSHFHVIFPAFMYCFWIRVLRFAKSSNSIRFPKVCGCQHIVNGLLSAQVWQILAACHFKCSWQCYVMRSSVNILSNFAQVQPHFRPSLCASHLSQACPWIAIVLWKPTEYLPECANQKWLLLIPMGPFLANGE